MTLDSLAFGPDGNLYVSSDGTNQVFRCNGNTCVVFASGNGLSDPEKLVFGPDGNLYISSFDANAVLCYNGTTGAFINRLVPE